MNLIKNILKNIKLKNKVEKSKLEADSEDVNKKLEINNNKCKDCDLEIIEDKYTQSIKSKIKY